MKLLGEWILLDIIQLSEHLCFCGWEPLFQDISEFIRITWRICQAQAAQLHSPSFWFSGFGGSLRIYLPNKFPGTTDAVHQGSHFEKRCSSPRQEIQERQVQSLGWKDPLGKEMASPFQYSCLENSMDRGAWWATVHGATRVRHSAARIHIYTCTLVQGSLCWGDFCLPGNIWKMSGNTFSFHNWKVILLGPSGQRPGMLLNVLQSTGHLPQAENYPV